MHHLTDEEYEQCEQRYWDWCSEHQYDGVAFDEREWWEDDDDS